MRKPTASKNVYLISTESKDLIQLYNSKINKIPEHSRPGLITTPYIEEGEVYVWNIKTNEKRKVKDGERVK